MSITSAAAVGPGQSNSQAKPSQAWPLGKKRGPWVGRLERIEAGGWLVLEGSGNNPLLADQ